MPATEMQLHSVFLALGVLLLVGLFCDEIGRRTRIPRVTLLILFGVTAGPSVLDILPAAIQDWHEFLAAAALTMVAFLLGGKLSLGTMRQHGRSIVLISLSVVIVTVAFVASGLLLAGRPFDYCVAAGRDRHRDRTGFSGRCRTPDTCARPVHRHPLGHCRS